jgi:hypothetical protein
MQRAEAREETEEDKKHQKPETSKEANRIKLGSLFKIRQLCLKEKKMKDFELKF